MFGGIGSAARVAGAAAAVCVAALVLGGSAVLAGGTGPSFTAQTVSLVLSNTNELVPDGVAVVTLAGHQYTAIAAAGRTSTNGVLNGTLAVYEGSTQYALLGENCCDPTGIAAADINGDGSPDFALASAGSGSTPPSFAVENTVPDPAGASFSGGGGASIANQGDGAGTPLVADLNGDGANDLVVPVPARNELVVLPGFSVSPASNVINTGGVRFVTVGSSPQAAAAADLNGDGQQDMVVAEHGTGDVGVMLGNGDLTYQAETGVAACTGPHDIAVADLNGDGKQDVAVACDSGSVAILLGKGDGSFQPAVTYATGTGTRALRIADLNNDGHPDIAAVSSGDDNLWTLFNPGDGTFPDIFSTSLGAGAQPWALDVADLNGDGIKDVVVADHGTVAFTRLVQSGLPDVTFAPTQYLVDSTADASDAHPGDGTCAAAGGACTLRAAVEESNATCGGVPIVVPAGTYQLNDGALVLRCSTEMSGAGARSTVITRAPGAAPSRVFEIARGTVAISGVSITNGLANGSDVEDNPGVGAGIWIDNPGHVSVSDSAISGNHASVSGGGIDNDGDLTVLRSTVSGNSVSGGALQIGGGIDHFGSDLSITNSTISGNAAVTGGGVLSGSDASFVNDTIADNTGGGFVRSGLANSQDFANTMVVDNAGADCNSSAVSSDDHDLSTDGTCAFTGTADPLLGPLQDNGGETDTQAPGSTGAAVDGGDDTACPATDQRGTARPQGAHCDIGAVELAAAAATVSAARSSVAASPSSVPADGSTASTITVTLRDTNGNAVAGKTMSVSASGDGATITGIAATTDGSGVATFAVKDATAQAVTFSARDETDGIDLSQTTAVTFTALPAVSPPATTPAAPPPPPVIVRAVTVDISGQGTVSSAAAGIACPGTCSSTVAVGLTPQLVATPAAGYAFAGWSGDCTGTGACTIPSSGPVGVTASFSPVAPPSPKRTADFVARFGGAIITAGQQLRPGSSVEFDASPTPLPLGAKAEYTWTFGDQTETVATGEPRVAHTFAKPGEFTVGLSVTFGDGTKAGATHGLLVVKNEPPVAIATTGAAGKPGQPIAFDASRSVDPDGKIVRYEIDQNGDGTVDISSATPPTSVTYDHAGTYQLRLTVIDNDGAQASRTYTMVVAAQVTLPLILPAPPQEAAPATAAATLSQYVPVAKNQPDATVVGCKSTTNCKPLSNWPVGTCLASVSKGGDLVFTASCIALVSVTPFATGTNYALQTQNTLSADGIEFTPAATAAGVATLHLSGDGHSWDVTGNANGVTYETVTLDPGTWTTPHGVDWSFVPKSGGGWTVSCVGAGGFRRCNSGAYPVPSGTTFQSLPVATIGWPTFSNGNADVAVATQLPPALTDSTSGVTQAQPAPTHLTTGTVEHATATQNQTRLPSQIAAADQAAGDTVTQTCDDALNATLPDTPTTLTLHFDDLEMGGFDLGAVDLTVDGNGDLFAMIPDATLPFGDDASFEAVLEIDAGKFAFGCAAADFGDPGIAIGSSGFFLSQAGLAAASNQAGVWVHGDAAAVSGAPIPAYNQPPMEIDADAEVIVPSAPGASWGFDINGTLFVLGNELVDGDVQYWSDGGGYVAASVAVQRINISWFTFDAQLLFRMQHGQWYFSAAADIGVVEIPSWMASISGQLVVSNIGGGVCGTVHALGLSKTVGVTYDWGDASPSISLGGCSLSSLEPPIPPTCDDIRTDIETMEDEFNLPASSSLIQQLQALINQHNCVGQRDLSTTLATPALRQFDLKRSGSYQFTFRGSTGSPVVTLVGPGGIFHTPIDDTPQAGHGAVAVRLQAARETVISVPKAQKGRWFAVVDPGSSGISSAGFAEVQPAPAVQAKVTHVSGRTYALHYKVTDLPGQTIVFQENGKDSGMTIGTAKGTTGTIDFEPSNGQAGTRSIVAQVLEHGHPIDSITLGRYTAPKPVLPGRVGALRLRRSGGGVVVSFRPVHGVTGYRVAVRASDGRRWQMTIRGRTARIPLGPDRRVTLRISVAGVDAAGRLGAVARVTRTF